MAKLKRNITIKPNECYELVGDYLNEYLNELVCEYLSNHVEGLFNDFEYELTIKVKNITYEEDQEE